MNDHVDKAIVYPFTDILIPILQYVNIQDVEMKVTTVIDKKRGFLNGKDMGYMKNQPKTGIVVSNDFEKEIGCSDVLIYTDEASKEIDEKSVFDDIKKMLEMQKKVICLRSLTDVNVNGLSKIALETKTDFFYCDIANQLVPKTEYEYIPRELYEPEASVIMIGEMFSGLDGENICLALSRNINSIGYKCVTVMEHKYARAVGAYAFPDFLKSDNTSECNKVYYLNNFVKYIDQTECPDVIIMLVPDPMLKYNRMFGNGFGIIPYLLSQAVHADCFIFCTQFDDVETKLFDFLSLNFENRFGFGIDFVHMSNIMLDLPKSNVYGKLSFLCHTQEKLNRIIEDKYKNNEIPIFNGLEKEQCDELSCAVIEKLVRYYDTNCELI